MPPSRLVAALVLPGLLVAALLADRALVRAREAAGERAEAARRERGRQAGLALRAEIAAIETDAASGRPREGVESWRVAAPLQGRLSARPSGLLGLSRAELIVRASSTDVTPSGLPVAVVAAAMLGEVRVGADVAEMLLSGRLPVHPDDLPALARALQAGDDPRVQALGDRLRAVPAPASLPRVPDFSRAATGGFVEGWARDGADVVHWRAPVRLLLPEDAQPAASGEPAAVAVEDVEGLAVVASPDARDTARLQRQRALTVAGFAGLGLLVVIACVVMHREERALARERSFIATVTHELRTPVTAMRLLGETLADGRGEPRDYGALIATECERVEALVERSLLAARTEQRLRPAATDVGDVLDRVAWLAEPLARRKGKSLSRDWPGDLPEAAWDGEAVRQALSNLVDNALRHGGTNVVVEARAEGGFVKVSVKDDGPGIRRRDSRRVFGRFERGDGAPGGAGLGLWLAEQVARGHGGRIDLATEEGVGCTFTLVLPERAPGSESA